VEARTFWGEEGLTVTSFDSAPVKHGRVVGFSHRRRSPLNRLQFALDPVDSPNPFPLLFVGVGSRIGGPRFFPVFPVGIRHKRSVWACSLSLVTGFVPRRVVIQTFEVLFSRVLFAYGVRS